jgi:hypothetical protein
MIEMGDGPGCGSDSTFLDDLGWYTNTPAVYTHIYIYINMHAIRKSIYIFLLGMWCHGHELP